MLRTQHEHGAAIVTGHAIVAYSYRKTPAALVSRDAIYQTCAALLHP